MKTFFRIVNATIVIALVAIGLHQRAQVIDLSKLVRLQARLLNQIPPQMLDACYQAAKPAGFRTGGDSRYCDAYSRLAEIQTPEEK